MRREPGAPRHPSTSTRRGRRRRGAAAAVRRQPAARAAGAAAAPARWRHGAKGGGGAGGVRSTARPDGTGPCGHGHLLHRRDGGEQSTTWRSSMQPSTPVGPPGPVFCCGMTTTSTRRPGHRPAASEWPMGDVDCAMRSLLSVGGQADVWCTKRRRQVDLAEFADPTPSEFHHVCSRAARPHIRTARRPIRRLQHHRERQRVRGRGVLPGLYRTSAPFEPCST